MIRFEQVGKKYPDGTVAVESLSLEAPSGQITVFVGPSGCGKTTSLRMINRMIEPTSGRIMLDDRDTGSFNKAELRRGIGYVIQHAGPLPAPHRRRQRRDRAAAARPGPKQARATAMELLERVGLPTRVRQALPGQLSGGQQQRVGVARALAADPPVMLMDEPFSAVDPVVRAQLQDEFLRLQGELGKTIVFVTHDIDEAVKLGDQVAVLRVGGNLAQLAVTGRAAHRSRRRLRGRVRRPRPGLPRARLRAGRQLPTTAEPTVTLGASGRGRRPVGASTAGCWSSATRSSRWAGTTRAPGSPAATAQVVTPDTLHRGGTVATQGGFAAGGPRRGALLAVRPGRARRRDRPAARHDQRA